jgi:hypothetical protein
MPTAWVRSICRQHSRIICRIKSQSQLAKAVSQIPPEHICPAGFNGEVESGLQIRTFLPYQQSPAG